MAVTVRTFYPVAPDYMAVNAWALAPTGKANGRESTACRILEFLGPGGFATPDDVEALEQCRRGSGTRRRRGGTTSPRACATTALL